MTKLPSTYKYKKAFWILSACGVCLAGCYVFLVFETVAHTVARKNAEDGIQKVLTDMSSLEANYLALESTITPDLATEKGFIAANNTIVVRPTAALSFRN